MSSLQAGNGGLSRGLVTGFHDRKVVGIVNVSVLPNEAVVNASAILSAQALDRFAPHHLTKFRLVRVHSTTFLQIERLTSTETII